MRGEIGVNVKEILHTRGMVRPNFYDCIPYGEDNEFFNDLSIMEESGECLHICGKNDWAFLALDILKPFKEEAEKIIKTVENSKKSKCIGAVVLGKNDKRIMDVYFGGKDSCTSILGIPVVLSDVRDKVMCLVEPEEAEIPFY